MLASVYSNPLLPLQTQQKYHILSILNDQINTFHDRIEFSRQNKLFYTCRFILFSFVMTLCGDYVGFDSILCKFLIGFFLNYLRWIFTYGLLRAVSVASRREAVFVYVMRDDVELADIVVGAPNELNVRLYRYTLSPVLLVRIPLHTIIDPTGRARDLSLSLTPLSSDRALLCTLDVFQRTTVFLILRWAARRLDMPRIPHGAVLVEMCLQPSASLKFFSLYTIIANRGALAASRALLV